MTGPGVLAFCGGGAFEGNDELDRRLLAEVAAERVVMLPTADAFEEPGALVATAMTWAERLGVEIEALMVMQRHDAEDDGAAGVVDAASAVYLAGDSSMHLRSVLKDTAVFAALRRVLERGGLVVAIGPSAAALSDPMFDVRGGALHARARPGDRRGDHPRERDVERRGARPNAVAGDDAD